MCCSRLSSTSSGGLESGLLTLTHTLFQLCRSEAAWSRRPRPWEESPAGNASPFCKYEAGPGPHGRRGPCGKDAEDYLKLLSRIRKLPVCASLKRTNPPEQGGKVGFPSSCLLRTLSPSTAQPQGGVRTEHLPLSWTGPSAWGVDGGETYRLTQ